LLISILSLTVCAPDLFMCATCDSPSALPALEAAFRPGRMNVAERRRGPMPCQRRLWKSGG
jgi:S-adenosylmethionine/arginine decarboxylase-like enzyme